jgi:GT2 family glycosyltransferase
MVRPPDPPVAVSVVVCGHNGAGFLPTLLAALERQTAPPAAWELVYVDDGSTDGSAALVAERFPGARIVRSEAPVGLPSARNLGIDAARADLLAFTDVDTDPEPDWIEAGIRRFEDEGVVYLAGGITIPVGEHPTVAAMVDATTFLDQELYVREGFSAGANFWVRRAVIDRVGAFNEALAAYGGDDDEFGWRVTTAGYPVTYAPEVHLRHPPRVRLRDVARKSYRLGLSQAARRRIPTGHWSGRRPEYQELRRLLPPKRLRRLPRVAGLDYQPTMLEMLEMHVARYACVQVARMAGDYVGERRARRLAA